MVAEPLKQRLELLQGSGQIDADVSAFVAHWLDTTGAELGVEITEANFANFCTHSALALQRARAGEAIDDWATDHGSDLASAPEAVAAADRFVRQAHEALDVDLPAQERDFVALHLAAVRIRSGRA